MILRKNVLPRSKMDYFTSIFFIIMIPLTYWFELFIVMPETFVPYSLSYFLNFIFAHFILFNVVGNYVGIILVDTSIRGRLMPSVQSVNDLNGELGYCSVCESVVPARSYHCPYCQVCILKRDHHCTFSACCIGHYNYRYFIMFLFYMTLATVYSFPYNLMFVWPIVNWDSLLNALKFFCPTLIIFFGLRVDQEQCFFFLFLVIVGGMAFVGFCFFYHMHLILSGQVVHEARLTSNKYDLGKMNNLKEVLGTRWYLACFSPFVYSPLPHDGITFALKAHSN